MRRHRSHGGALHNAQSYGGGQSGPRAILPSSEEIALARSAAPAALSDSATIYALTETGYEIAVTGTNGAACYVSRDWLHSIEPHCFDAEGAVTVLPMAMRRVELLHQGRTRDQADREIANGLLEGRFRVPTRGLEALSIARTCPHLKYGGRVAVRAIVET